MEKKNGLLVQNVQKGLLGRMGWRGTWMGSIDNQRKQLQEERGKIYKSEYCDKTFKDSTNREKHQNNMHNDRSETSDEKPKLVNDKIVESDPEPTTKDPVLKTDFYCEKCDKYLAKADYLSQHLKMVHNQCDKCNDIFESKSDLVKHTKAEHPIIEYKTCHLCGYRTNSKNTYFNKHMKMVHGKEKRFACTECPKRFARKNGLRKRRKKRKKILKRKKRKQKT